MSTAGRGAALPYDNEPTVDAITRGGWGCALAALRLAVADAHYSLAEMDRRTRQVQRMVSRGFIRAGANAGQRGAL
jgi:hypothetical protein